MKVSAKSPDSETLAIGVANKAPEAMENAAAGNVASLPRSKTKLNKIQRVSKNLLLKQGRIHGAESATDSSEQFTEIEIHSNADQQHTPPNGKHRTKTQSRKRDLINLQSNLSPKYIGYANANSPTTISESTEQESADQGRKTRRRNHAATLNSSSNELNGRDSDTASPKILTAGLPILTIGASRAGGAYLSPIDKLLIKNGANSPNSTGFEADAEDIAVVQRKTVKRKLKRGTKAKSKSTNEIANTVNDEIVVVKKETGEKILQQEQLPVEMNQILTNDVPILDIKVEISDESAAIVAGDTEEAAEAIIIDQTTTEKSQVETMFAMPAATSTEFEGLKSPPDHREVVNNSEQSIKSPSSISLDSAKGSSIVTDSGWPTYHVGDLYWGKLFTYCYWPCMVCPDELDQIVGDQQTHPQRKSTDSVPGALSVQVHVRFFADNNRHNWIRSENLLPFLGLKAYEELRENTRIQHGVRSLKYRQMVAKQSKLQVWRQAIEEANIVAQLPYEERVKKFNEIFESSITVNKQKRKKRKGDTSDVGSSLYDSADNLPVKTVAVKRERSSSPFRPSFSPVKSHQQNRVKRRKLSGSVEEQVGLASVPEEEDVKPISLDLGDSEDPEFRLLFDAIKEYVMVHQQGDKVDKILMAVVNNIWSLKQIQLRNLERDLAEGDGELLGSARLTSERGRGIGQIKRLSNRLKTMVLRRSLTPVVPAATTDAIQTERRQSEHSKVRKLVGRPIDEVVQDILQLDRKYLFRGLNREPVCKYCHEPGGDLKRCSRQCSNWLHAACLKKPKTGVKKPIRGQKSIAASTTTAGISSRVLEPLTSSSPILDVEAPVKHITGDGVQADQETDLIVCHECASGKPDVCCICNQEELPANSPPASPQKDGALLVAEVAQEPPGKLLSCCQPMCNAKFHSRCCKYWPQASFRNSTASSRCPMHVCHICVSDDPSGKYQLPGNSKLIKCVKCPATYHQDSRCIPAGSRLLTLTHLICPRHNTAKADANLNVLWCYICVRGGELVCCETCPIAVHAHCRNIPIKKNESYICEECESGRLPLYGEIVWAKFNNFRWWPSIILPPTEIPINIQRKPHGINDFVVRFFGTHDHGWISRRRVYLYIEGDTGDSNSNRSQMFKYYKTGVEEATRFLRIIKAKRQEQAISRFSGNKLYPPPYVKIKANKAVPPVRFVYNEEDQIICTCDPNSRHPCGPESGCLNRILFSECNPKLCLAGNKCENQLFELRNSPRLEVIYMNERGFGLVCREQIFEGDFIIEYVGEVIDHAEFQRRMTQKQNDRDENFYFLGVEKNFIIDAGPKGNLARFMNHSCEPNCASQKWKVNGIHRVGLFAIKDIPENTELTFNYLWDDLMNNDKKACFCGANRCSGKIGGKLKDELPKEAKVKQVPRQGTVRNNGAKPKKKANKKSDSNPKTADNPTTSEAAGRRSRS